MSIGHIINGLCKRAFKAPLMLYYNFIICTSKASLKSESEFLNVSGACSLTGWYVK
jgi:hypothetical protein